MIQNGMIYKLFANCVRVKGYRRAIICDLQRNIYHLIPHSLYDLFDEQDVLETDLSDCSDEEHEILDEYIKFLLENTLIFPIDRDELQLFPKLDVSWDFPSIATNMIIDVDGLHIDWANLSAQLDEIKCYYLQIRCYSFLSVNQLENIAANFSSSLLQAFEIIAPYNSEFEEAQLIFFAEKNPKLRSLTIYNASESKELRALQKGFGGISFIKENITGASHCGLIHPWYFSFNTETFTESLAHNSCLNRKISIDTTGNIKNCPSMKETFGTIKNTSLMEAINKAGFKKYWNITKDEISKCKDCEFRHVCTDCRAYLENPEDIYSAPLKCGYNPYTCEWEEWSVNPLKQNAREHYKIKEQSILSGS